MKDHPLLSTNPKARVENTIKILKVKRGTVHIEVLSKMSVEGIMIAEKRNGEILKLRAGDQLTAHFNAPRESVIHW